MKLTVKQDKQGLIFKNSEGVFYRLNKEPNIKEGSAKERGRKIVMEFLDVTAVCNAETKGKCGWPWSISQKINHRIEELRTELMHVCANEFENLFK